MQPTEASVSLYATLYKLLTFQWPFVSNVGTHCEARVSVSATSTRAVESTSLVVIYPPRPAASGRYLEVAI